MKLTIDLETRTITLLDKIDFEELRAFMEKLGGQWTVEQTVRVEQVCVPTTQPWQPWTTYPLTTEYPAYPFSPIRYGYYWFGRLFP